MICLSRVLITILVAHRELDFSLEITHYKIDIPMSKVIVNGIMFKIAVIHLGC